jgi:hypothetical protein
MSKYSDTSDVRTLARAILAQEEREQSSMRARVPSYELDPVQRRFVAATRTGFSIGIALAAFSAVEGVVSRVSLLEWLTFSLACAVVATAVGAVIGLSAGFIVRWTQRRSLDAELESLDAEPS